MLGSREPVARQPVIQQCTSVPEDVTSVQCSSVLLCVVCYNFVSGATDLALFTHVPIYIPEYVSSCFRIGEFLPIGECLVLSRVGTGSKRTGLGFIRRRIGIFLKEIV